MKNYRLKKEAVPFFNKDLAPRIENLETWTKHYNVDQNALEEIEEVFVKYGIPGLTEGSSSLSGWSKEDGARYHFTVVFPSVKHSEYDAFQKGAFSRRIMNAFQQEANIIMTEFVNESK